MVKKIAVIVFTFLLVIMYFVSEINKPHEYNWRMNFNGISKDPYGCYILRKTLQDHKQLNFQTILNETFFSSLPKIQEPGSTIIVITDRFRPDSIELQSLYKFISGGNNIFISAYSFDNGFQDTLNFNINTFFTSFKNASDRIALVNPSLECTGPLVYHQVSPVRFTGIDTANHLILGTSQDRYANYIKIPFGKGAFYIHSQPLAFTNYHLLNSHSDYPYAALSYFRNTSLFWNDYYKPDAGKYSPESQTPFRFFLSNDSLRISLYLTLILIFVYFLIESKRKQRFIPVIEPPVNSTIRFVSTIARLYLGQPDHKKMALKKFLYFREAIYSRYMYRIDANNPASAEQFAEKTGYDLKKINELFSSYRQIESAISIYPDMLVSFSEQIDRIYEYLDSDKNSKLHPKN